MSLKRKRPSQGKQPAAPEPPPLPEPPKTPSPLPWTLPFPRLPTLDDSPIPEDTELKRIPDSGVLATALLQSRELWIQGYHFPKVWKPTRRGRKDPASSQYVTTRIGICPVVIGPHIFPDARFLWVRKVDEEAEKAEKAKKAAEKAKKAAKAALPKPPPPPPPTPAVTPSATTVSNALTVKALTEIAATSPEFSAILQAVANRTATPEQHAALTQYMRAASLIGPGRTTVATPTPAPNSSSVPVIKPVTPITTIPKTPITTIPTTSTSTPKPSVSNIQSAPIPPVPNITPGPPPIPAVPQRPLSTPVTRIPPPTGNITSIPPLPNINRAPITTPITRIPPPSTPVQPTVSSASPAPATPALSSPSAVVNPPTVQPVPPTTSATSATPATPGTPAPKLITSSLTPAPVAISQPATPTHLSTSSQIPPTATTDSLAPTTPQIDPMSFVEIAFELAEPGERLLIPRHTILEKFTSRQGGINVLASFILTIQENTVWIPITLKLNNCPPKIYESLAKYVFAPGVVATEMEKVMRESKRFEARVLRLQIPIDEEGFVWAGLERKGEKKKYVRKKKENKENNEIKVEEGEEEQPAGKKKKSLVVGLKYTPGKKETGTGTGEMAEIEVENVPSGS